MPKLQQLYKEECEYIRAVALETLSLLKDDLGVEVTQEGNAKYYINSHVDVTFRISLEGKDPGRDTWSYVARQYGLEKEDFGRQFSSNGRRFEITGINTRRPRYPISAKQVGTGKGFKFPVSTVKFALEKEA